MTALGIWLKQLIMVVLLAVFADLLLPTKAMQKYVRVVMGLAIIAVILQPLTPLFQANWADKLADYATNNVLLNRANSTSVGTGFTDDLQETLQREQEVQVNQLAANQLEQQLSVATSCKPKSLVITGISQGPSEIDVEVVIGSSDASKSEEVSSWLADKLGISSRQIHIRTE